MGKFFIALWLLAFGACSDGETFTGEQDLKLARAGGGEVVFKVKVARSPEELAKGLMYYKNMPLLHGMLFDFGSERPVKMWMKNTFMPLDMLFFDGGGTLIYMEKHAVPHTLDPRGPNSDSVRYVLELKAGAGDRLGLQIGDRLMIEGRL